MAMAGTTRASRKTKTSSEREERDRGSEEAEAWSGGAAFVGRRARRAR